MCVRDEESKYFDVERLGRILFRRFTGLKIYVPGMTVVSYDPDEIYRTLLNLYITLCVGLPGRGFEFARHAIFNSNNCLFVVLSFVPFSRDIVNSLAILIKAPCIFLLFL